MNLARNCLLALVSLGLGLAACEMALRKFHPKYRHLADVPRDLDKKRNWWLRPNLRSASRHPDTHTRHRILLNNLGARQHRDFAVERLGDAVNIAFFGDSFTENTRMAAPYSFTEGLDFLLNASALGAKASSPAGPARRFNVINFGVEAHGTGQQYTHYQNLTVKRHLDHVLYMYFWDDILQLRERSLFRRDDDGALVAQHVDAAPTKRWPAVLSRLHLTYLLLEAWQRPGLARWRSGLPSVREGRAVFHAVLTRWRQEVERSGGAFHLVLLPDLDPRDELIRAELPAELDVLDLHSCFAKEITDYDYDDWRFRHDGHWNEGANMVAAHCLYRHLERQLELPRRTDEDLARTRYAYYRGLAAAPAWEGERWMPAAPWILPGPLAPGVARDIAERYLPLERRVLEEDARWQRRMRAAKRARQSAPLASGVWDVYAALPERLLVYVKKPCALGDVAARFFLHAVPADPADLPADRVQSGFFNLDFDKPNWTWREDGECSIPVTLPKQRLLELRTGQFAPAENGSIETLWAVEFPLRDALPTPSLRSKLQRAPRGAPAPSLRSELQRAPQGAHAPQDTHAPQRPTLDASSGVAPRG